MSDWDGMNETEEIEFLMTKLAKLREAVRTAKELIGARSDTASEAIKASNINQAWHILSCALAE